MEMYHQFQYCWNILEAHQFQGIIFVCLLVFVLFSFLLSKNHKTWMIMDLHKEN